MKLSKITIVFCALIGKICSTGIVIRTSKPTESSDLIVEATANILASCYGNKEYAIGFYGNLPETLIETLWSRLLIPIYLINNTDCADRPRFHRRKLNVFVIVGTEWSQIVHGVETISCSRWSNRRASLLIVDWTPTQQYGCYSLDAKFYIPWVRQIFNVNVLCLSQRQGPLIFGYNPHTTQAPAPWQFLGRFESPKFQGSSFFARRYEQKGLCKNLDFDKVNDLGGTPIYFTHHGSLPKNNDSFILPYKKTNKPNMLLFGSEGDNIFNTFIRQVNGIVRMTIRSPGAKIIGISTRRANYETENTIEKTYPYMQMGLSIMTNFEGNKSQLRKIFTVVDVYSRFGTCLVLLITLIFFKFVVRQALVPAILNVVRITCNTGFTNLPDHNGPRIYLTGLLFFVVTIQGIFTGNLASLLTTEVPVKHAETIQDLIDRNYTIYAGRGFRTVVEGLMYEDRIVLWTNDTVNCIDFILNDPSGGCVDLRVTLLDTSVGYNVYVSSNSIFNKYWAYRTEEDWPFIEKFNKVLITMNEANIVDTFHMRLIRNRLSYVEPEDVDPKIMTLKDLGFTFVILGIGLTCATVSFILEVSIKPIRSAIAKVRQRLFNGFRQIKIIKLKG